MQSVGVRELKANLSRYLKRVKSGESIVVTERKKEVAVILPSASDSHEEKVLELIQRGLVHWSGGKPKGRAPRIVSKGQSVSEAVLEDRR